jgi:hypothetical protein
VQPIATEPEPLSHLHRSKDSHAQRQRDLPLGVGAGREIGHSVAHAALASWGLLLTVVAVGAGAWFGLADHESQHSCANVGLTTHTSGSAPQADVAGSGRREMIPRTGLSSGE